MDTQPIFSLAILPKDGIEALPEPENPYYVATRQGTYLYKRNMLGKFLLPVRPDDLPEGFYHDLPADDVMGVIWREFPSLPASLMGQAVDFFQRTYDRQKTEAELLITYNEDADPCYRLFCPTQRVSGGGVQSIHDAGHFERGWQLVGSLHSHADMAAFHSGTDINDASSFAGIHITVGHLGHKEPSFAAMITINDVRKDYKIEAIADISEIRSHPSPGWWDRYITADPDRHASKNLPKGAYTKWTGKLTRPQTGTVTYGWQTGYEWGDDDYSHQWAQWVPAPNPDAEPRPPMTRAGYRYSSQMGGLVQERFLKQGKYTNVINPDFAAGAFIDRLDELVSLAEKFGLEIVYDVIDEKGYSFINEMEAPLPRENRT